MQKREDLMIGYLTVFKFFKEFLNKLNEDTKFGSHDSLSFLFCFSYHVILKKNKFLIVDIIEVLII